VPCAIDDFGTGYSSLAYLARLPISAVKVDRSFVLTMTDNADTMAIVSAIIALAHSMNLKVVAEGVDTAEQLKFLRLMRCDELQGFLFSRGVPSAEFVELVRSGRRLE
jgi:EAL domain-containing protein (putative c-di-GMP-specific phosphodiesterase class I)